MKDYFIHQLFFPTHGLTAKEYTVFLQQLYARNYILVQQHHYIEQSLSNFAIPTVPIGKRPLILSLQYDGELIQITERFIQEHPTFTWQGSRGIIAVTGSDIQQLHLAATPLKNQGWVFACMGAPTSEKARLWKETAEPILGNVDICFTDNDQLSGFSCYCPQNHSRQAILSKNHVIIPMITITAETIRQFSFEMALYYGCATHNNALTQENLLVHANYFLHIPTLYLWGGLGTEITAPLLKWLQKKYPDHYPAAKLNAYATLIDTGYIGCDCSGLLKNFLFGGPEHFQYNPKRDYNSSHFYEHALIKGPLKNSWRSMPEIPGICLYMDGHIGLYIGDGEVIESTNNPRFGNGVIKSNIDDRNWLCWSLCPHVSYRHYFLTRLL